MAAHLRCPMRVEKLVKIFTIGFELVVKPPNSTHIM
jgi:hypothetical protein